MIDPESRCPVGSAAGKQGPTNDDQGSRIFFLLHKLGCGMWDGPDGGAGMMLAVPFFPASSRASQSPQHARSSSSSSVRGEDACGWVCVRVRACAAQGTTRKAGEAQSRSESNSSID